MNPLLRILNSRKLAGILLGLLIALLLASTYLPSKFTVTSEAQWQQIKDTRPIIYEISKYAATPELVNSWFFIALSTFLFLSTLTCTIIRISQWFNSKKTEFEKEKAFSFTVSRASGSTPGQSMARMLAHLSGKGWQCSTSDDGLAAQRGISLGFLGSIMFHIGLLTVFVAAPVTALTLINCGLRLTDGIGSPSMREAATGQRAMLMPDVPIEATKLWGKYFDGLYKEDFGADIAIGDSSPQTLTVNKPLFYDGYQLALTKYGPAPCIEIKRGQQTLIDSCARLALNNEGDYLPAGVIAPGTTVFLMYFPEFYREGGMLKSRSYDDKDPVALVKLYRNGAALHKGLLLKPGEAGEFEGLTIKFTELRHWIEISASKEYGMMLIFLGSAIGIPGLFVRLMSNERRLEFEFGPAATQNASNVTIKGYSRYYPAFLEKEVNELAELLK